MNISPTDLIRFVVEIKIFEHESLNKEQYLTQIPFNYHFLELIKSMSKSIIGRLLKPSMKWNLVCRQGSRSAVWRRKAAN